MKWKTLFTWIHLSDLQISRDRADAAQPWEPEALLRALRDDLAAQSEWHPANALFVTGDVAFTGKPAEYQAARACLDGLARAVGLGPERVFVVPGNHDVDRGADADPHTARLLRELRADPRRLGSALALAPDRDRLSGRMAAYLDFAAGLAPACLAHPVPPPAARLFWTHCETHGALRLRILGLNTALLAADDHDRRQLALGDEQLGLALRAPPPAPGELVIALGHHPVHAGWLADANDAAARMHERVHVHLSGHVHDLASAVLAGDPDGRALRAGAGVVHSPPHVPDAPAGYRYVIGSVLARVGDRRLHVMLSPRRWSAGAGAFVEEEDAARAGLPFHENPLATLWPVPAHVPRAATAPLPLRSTLARRLLQTVARVWRPASRGLPVATALPGAAPAPRRPRPPTPPPRLRRLGRLRLVEQLARGGTGTIWRAHDPHASEDVAVKILHRHLAASPRTRDRFFRSAHVMVGLANAHPGVVRIRDPEASDHGYFYYVMDLVPHGTLHDAVLRERLLRSQIEPLVLGVARVLAMAHQRGLVHREVKPTHILFTRAGAPCLIDFGLASAEHAPESPGGAAGPYPHVAPELRDCPHQADARADVHGLGMTMAFMLHGAPLPHDIGRESERLVRGLPCEPPLRQVLERAVAWDPEQRFPHAGAFCDALEAAMGRFRDTTAIKLVEPGAAPHLRGVPSLLQCLRTLGDEAWMHSPVLARLDVAPATALEHARARLRDMREWPARADAPDRSALRRLEYLVREWAFDGAHLLVPATPSADPTQPVIIGCSRSCDVTVREVTVSKRHAAVRFDPDAGGYLITDQGSRHGTGIDGEKLPSGASALLASGNLVTLGKSVFVFFEPRLLRRLAKAL